jgi:DNA repair exonuclease SbcCD ATPase subunit
MQLCRAHLRHFCQLRDLEVLFNGRLNLVVGPNGAGKTNFLRALQGGLTGDFGDSTREEDVSQFAEEGDPAFVELEIENKGHVYVVRRQLRSTGITLRIDGETTGRGIREINERLLNDFGATKKQVTDYVFVRQEGVSDLIRKTATERGKEFAALFGTIRAETIWKKLGDRLSKVEMPTSNIGAATVTKELADAVLAADAWQKKIDQLEGEQVGNLKEMRVQRRLLSDQQHTRQTHTRRLSEGHHDYQRCHKLRKELAATYEEDRRTVDLISTELNARQEDAKTAAETVKQWIRYKSNEKIRATLTLAEGRVRGLWKERDPRPARPDDYWSSEEDRTIFYDEYHPAHDKFDSVSRRVRELGDLIEGGSCPTCGQAVVDLADRQQELLTELAQRQPIIDRLAARQARCHTYDLQMDMTKQYLEGIKRGVDRCRELRGTITEVNEPNQSEEYAERMLRETDELKDGLQVARESLIAHDTRLESVKTDIDRAEACIREAEEELEKIPDVTDTDISLMDEVIAAAEAREAEITECKIAMADVINRQTTAQRLLDHHNAITREALATKLAVVRLDAVRKVFHRDEAPRMVSFTYLEHITDDVNEVLDIFEAPFRVEADDALGFTAYFSDGRVQVDKRLSVGERIVLAMAFRIAINSTFASSLGLLVLDEPTAGLDEHNLGCLPTALERLRSLSDDRGLQVIFVTHEPRISHLFDNVIRIGE